VARDLVLPLEIPGNINIIGRWLGRQSGAADAAFVVVSAFNRLIRLTET
jgi:hypothetical protein